MFVPHRKHRPLLSVTEIAFTFLLTLMADGGTLPEPGAYAIRFSVTWLNVDRGMTRWPGRWGSGHVQYWIILISVSGRQSTSVLLLYPHDCVHTASAMLSVAYPSQPVRCSAGRNCVQSTTNAYEMSKGRQTSRMTRMNVAEIKCADVNWLPLRLRGSYHNICHGAIDGAYSHSFFEITFQKIVPSSSSGDRIIENCSTWILSLLLCCCSSKGCNMGLLSFVLG
jgi:hypothetical protein